MSPTTLTSPERSRADLAGLPGVVFDETRLAAAAVDRSGVRPSGLPLALVRATSVDDVRRTMRLAHEHRIPVVPRGAGSGVAGGATAGSGSVVLDLSGLDRICDIDPRDETADVEPGVVTADLDRAAAAHGLRYAPDPASAAFSTIGGNIATNAGGMRCVKYGVTRDAVLGLDVVLADGSLVHTGRRTVKGVAGLDVTSLFVGSEGVLGVIVGATLRLRPLPEATATVAATFADVVAAADGCAALARERRQPSVLELLDHATLEIVDRAQGSQHARRGGALVIAQADGPGAAVEAAAIAEVLNRTALAVEHGVDEVTSERLLQARRLALPSIEAFGRALIEDICVPRSRLAEAFAGVQEISRRTGVAVYSFAHAGDGNLHPSVIVDPTDEAAREHGERVLDRVSDAALALGGTLSGEHGIGSLKRHALPKQLDPATLAAHRLVKEAFDPHHILSPGRGI
jgi:glycolate oxidase